MLKSIAQLLQNRRSPSEEKERYAVCKKRKEIRRDKAAEKRKRRMAERGSLTPDGDDGGNAGEIQKNKYQKGKCGGRCEKAAVLKREGESRAA